MTMNPAEGEEEITTIREELNKHYDLLRTLGQGTFAEVKLAKHKISKKIVAIKIINKVENSDHPCSEALILRNLNHPHIVKLYHVIESPMTTCLVLEYATKGDLLEYVMEYKCLKEEEACRIFHQLVDAVEFCHKNHVVHRDLKPENILIDNDYNIKLSDFGLSAFFSDEKQLELYCGTLPFMAPEIIRCQPYHGPEVDIWSLGIILFFMVTGSVPFPSENFAELEGQFLQLKKVMPAYISPELYSLICDILKIDPLERPLITHLKRHIWLKNSPPGFIRNKRKASYARVTKVMCAMGFSLCDIRESLLYDQYDSTMAAYLLLEEMSPEDAVNAIQTKAQDQGDTTCKLPIISSVIQRDREPCGHSITLPLQNYVSKDEASSSEESMSKASTAPPTRPRYRRLMSSSAWNPSDPPGAGSVPVCTNASGRHYGQPMSSSPGSPLAKPGTDLVPVCTSGSGRQIYIRDLFLAQSSPDTLVDWNSKAACFTGTSANSQGLVGRASTANNETKHSLSPYSQVVLVNLTRWCYPVSAEVTNNLRKVNKSVQVSVVKNSLAPSNSQFTTRDTCQSTQTYLPTHSSVLEDNLSGQLQVAPTIEHNTEVINPIEDSKKKNTSLRQSCPKFATMIAGHSTKYYSSYRSSLPENDESGQPQVAPVTNHDSGDIVPTEDSIKQNTLPIQGSNETAIEKCNINQEQTKDSKKRSHQSIPRRILSCLRRLCCCCLGTKAKCPKVGKKIAPQSCHHLETELPVTPEWISSNDRPWTTG
ncbi:serine/threonine-protein kinase MARK2-like [Dipodomys spectabilis]|uniref:serine/threonine-protein kinase MARK2-like n=1 Tax=Dipodomys spectabilis TaxID=105255 RepID=UPI001C549ADF|nr:serine/threonine-protein kinase MARK2-like [Dipodomys spectabilis]